MIPLLVPSTIDADTAMHVGAPRLRFPASVKACPFNFFSLVHRTTSQGGDWTSVSSRSSRNCELSDALRLWPWIYAGDEGRGEFARGLPRKLEEESRAWNRRSNGRKEGVGLLRPGRDATDGRALLPGEEKPDPWRQISHGMLEGPLHVLGEKVYRQGLRATSRWDSLLVSAWHLPSLHLSPLRHDHAGSPGIVSRSGHSLRE